MIDAISVSHSMSVPSTEIITMQHEDEDHPIPWYKRLFKKKQPHLEDENELSESEELDPVVLQVNNIHKTYLLGLEGVPAIRGIDLRVKRGEFVIIVGKSGSGKSSLLNILGTVDLPTRGEMFISGYAFNGKSKDKDISDIRLHAIGFVFQTFNLIPGMTAYQNIELPLLLNGKLSRFQRQQTVTELLQRVGMSNRKDHYPSQLSGGEQQRIAIARGLANSPDILLLDEPTGDLDTLSTIRIMNLLVELNNMGTTLVMVTHDMQLPTIATRIVIMSDGKIQNVINNNEEDRYCALQKLNEGIEDLAVFESSNMSINSELCCSTTEIRQPTDYDAVHRLESTETKFNFNYLKCINNRSNYLTQLVGIVCILLCAQSMRKMNNEVPEAYMDEIFHFPMTQRYYEGNYTYWDPKITTFPGLYVFGSIYCKILYMIRTILGLNTENVCSLPSLRWMNFILMIATAISIYHIVKRLNPTNKHVKSFLWTLQTIGIPTILCPFFLYYTDGLSLFLSCTSITFALLSDKGEHYKDVILSAIFTFLAISVRQTNVILTILNPAIIVMLRYGLLHKSDKYPSFGKELIHLFTMIISDFQFIVTLAIPYLIPFISFIIFFIWNDFSVVLGDKENHQITFHLMQLCYFSIFFCVNFVDEIIWKLYYSFKDIKNTFKERRRGFLRFVLCSLFAFYCVWKHTVIHPFIRADNRHFVFYLFKDIIIPYKYWLVPIYGLCLAVMIGILASKLTTLAICVTSLLFGVILVSSPVVEFRYYTLPILVLICIIRPKTHPIISLTISLSCNAITAYLFFYRSFIWPDGSIARFMW